MEDANARLKGWQEDVELLLSFLEGFVRERQVVFASSPYLTSRRFYDLCLQHDVRTAADLRTALGEDAITKLLAKNKEEAALFAQNLHTATQPFVLNPTAFVVDPAKTGRKWAHSEYGDCEEVPHAVFQRRLAVQQQLHLRLLVGVEGGRKAL